MGEEEEVDGHKWRVCILSKLLRGGERVTRERERKGEIAFLSRLHFSSRLVRRGERGRERERG